MKEKARMSPNCAFVVICVTCGHVLFTWIIQRNSRLLGGGRDVSVRIRQCWLKATKEEHKAVKQALLETLQWSTCLLYSDWLPWSSQPQLSHTYTDSPAYAVLRDYPETGVFCLRWAFPPVKFQVHLTWEKIMLRQRVLLS